MLEDITEAVRLRVPAARHAALRSAQGQGTKGEGRALAEVLTALPGRNQAMPIAITIVGTGNITEANRHVVLTGSGDVNDADDLVGSRDDNGGLIATEEQVLFHDPDNIRGPTVIEDVALLGGGTNIMKG